MKRKGVFIVVFILLIMTSLALAGLNKRYVLLDQVTSTGPGDPVVIVDAFNEWGCDIAAFGTPSSIVFRFEGNEGGAVFDADGWATKTFDAAEIAAGFASISISTPPLKQVRGNLVTLTGGGSPDVTVSCVGRDS